MIGILGVAAFAVPVLAYFAFVSRYGVNVVIFDQWSDVALIGKAFSGHLNVGDLWAQHNQNRILFPNLIVLFLAYTTHLDVHLEEYFSAVLIVGSVVLIIWTHRRRSPTTPLLWYCPVTVLMLSWVQYENTLWGFQLAWYVVMICLAGALFALDHQQLTTASVVAAVAITVVGSYSSIQGLLIWPAGFLLLLYRRRSGKVLIAWASATVATTLLYFLHFKTSQLPPYEIDPLIHPFFALKLFFFSLGNVAGKPLTIPVFPVPTHNHLELGAANPFIVVLGVVVFIGAVLGVASIGFGRARERPEPVGVSLILFAFGFDAFTTIGRGLHGYAGVSASRYTTFNMLALVGAYLIVISRPSQRRSAVGRRHRPVRFSLGPIQSTGHGRPARIAVRTIPFLVIVCVVAGAVFGYANGVSGARRDHAVEVQATSILREYESRGNGTERQSRGQLTDPQIVTGFMTQLIPVAKQDGLSLFNAH